MIEISGQGRRMQNCNQNEDGKGMARSCREHQFVAVFASRAEKSSLDTEGVR